MSDLPVLVHEIDVGSGLSVGHAQLNAEATLNSLSLEMIDLLDAALRKWADNASVAAVVITAVGDKAFCAGGDIQALYHAIGANHAAGEVVDDYPFRFFEQEYRLDYLLHTFAKPVVCLGHGIVMGGGLGIFSASRYRVLTDRSRLAVPEITIGLFPDAGASWTLGNMQPHHAAFLGLTGSHVNATDSLLTAMGTHVTDHGQREAWLTGLLALSWSGDNTQDHQLVQDYLDALPSVAMPDSELSHVPQRHIDAQDLLGEARAIFALEGSSKWIDRGIGNLRNGCPVTAGIVMEQLRRVPALSLADTFRMELTIATHCANNPDFLEGVRALLIDKDNAPQWSSTSLEDLSKEYVLSHFEPPWPSHPLADLV